MSDRIATTDRLFLRRLVPEDAPFIVRLLNEPAFLEYIGDKGVRDLDDAVRYLQEGPLAMYAKHGHGLYGVALKESGELIGISGLLHRDEYEDIDLGYAFLAEHRGGGYASEAGAAVLRVASEVIGARKVIALVAPANGASIRVLEKLGFRSSTVPPAKPDTIVFERTFED
ncbi:MAG TPA: GNAT family N-acetyltransferase [Thermoanaerobaculia bacterium]